MTISQSLTDRAVTVRLEPGDPSNADRLPIERKREIGALVREGCEVLLFACNGRLMRHWAPKEEKSETSS